MRRWKVLSEAEKVAIRELAHEGLCATEISRRLNRSKPTICRFMKRDGHKMRAQRSLTAVEKGLVRKLAREGLGSSEIARRINRPQPSVWRFMKSVPGFRTFPIKYGPLSDETKDKIHELHEQGVKAWTIARTLQIHPSSCCWYMWGQGLKTLGNKKPIYKRGGKTIVPFSAEEDDFILEKRIEGLTPVVIARMHLEKFPHLPHPRSRDTIASRLLMLASDETAREVA